MAALRKSMNADLMLGQLIMKLNRPENRKKVVVWVEGKDWRFYRKLFDEDKILEFGMGGGDFILEGHNKLKKKCPKQLSIVIHDADFLRLNGVDLTADPNVFYTDAHDVEMMMMKHPDVRKDICDTFEVKGDRKRFYEKVFGDLYYLSYFKWFNNKESRGYAFDPLSKVQQSQAKLSDLDWIEGKLHACAESRWVAKDNPRPFKPIKTDEIKEFIRENSPVDPYEITTGHDFYNRLCLHIKNETPYARDEEGLKDTVVTSYDCSKFETTSLYQALNDWCADNIDILKRAV